jgi:hypothetical protein
MEAADGAAVSVGCVPVPLGWRGVAASPGGALAAAGCRRRLARLPGWLTKRRSCVPLLLTLLCRSSAPTSWWTACMHQRAPCTAALLSCATRWQVGGLVAGQAAALAAPGACHLRLAQHGQRCPCHQSSPWQLEGIKQHNNFTISSTAAAVASSNSDSSRGQQRHPRNPCAPPPLLLPPSACLPACLPACLQAWASARTSTCCPRSPQTLCPPATQSTGCCCRCARGRLPQPAAGRRLRAVATN